MPEKSEQLEAGGSLDDNFRGMAADEIERFRREIVERSGDAKIAQFPASRARV
jgi:type III restriction enzyme